VRILFRNIQKPDLQSQCIFNLKFQRTLAANASIRRARIEIRRDGNGEEDRKMIEDRLIRHN
jgi:hypothetical protein